MPGLALYRTKHISRLGYLRKRLKDISDAIGSLIRADTDSDSRCQQEHLDQVQMFQTR